MSAKPPQSAGSPIFAALEDRRALLLGYVKNDVVTLDKLALLWTIEAACGGSLSRAPETHPVLLHQPLVPACWPDCRAVFRELAVDGTRYALGGWRPNGCEPWEAVMRDRTLGRM